MKAPIPHRGVETKASLCMFFLVRAMFSSTSPWKGPAWSFSHQDRRSIMAEWTSLGNLPSSSAPQRPEIEGNKVIIYLQSPIPSAILGNHLFGFIKCILKQLFRGYSRCPITPSRESEGGGQPGRRIDVKTIDLNGWTSQKFPLPGLLLAFNQNHFQINFNSRFQGSLLYKVYGGRGIITSFGK